MEIIEKRYLQVSNKSYNPRIKYKDLIRIALNKGIAIVRIEADHYQLMSALDQDYVATDFFRTLRQLADYIEDL
jgi:hypothetical protein